MHFCSAHHLPFEISAQPTKLHNWKLVLLLRALHMVDFPRKLSEASSINYLRTQNSEHTVCHSITLLNNIWPDICLHCARKPNTVIQYVIIATHPFHFPDPVNSHPSNVRHFHFSIGRFCVYTLHKDVLYASDVFICLVRLDFHLSVCSQCESFKLPLSELQFLCVCSTKHINKLELFFPLSVSLYLCLSTASDCVDILFSSIAAHIRTACFLSSIR